MKRALAAVREARWLSEERARAYAVLVAVMILLQALSLVGKIVWTASSDPLWRPVVTDFDAFWSGARLLLQGTPARAYDIPAMIAAEQQGAQPVAGQFLPYLYPPVFLMLSAPLGLLPYLASMAAFALAGYAAVVACLRRILPAAWPLLPVLAFPAAMMNATMGQTAAIATLCFGGAMLWLDRRPALAGACLGMLVYKPHLALCVPVALLAARRWTALASCAATALALLLLSRIVLGGATWLAFRQSMFMAREVLLDQPTWMKMTSIYGAVRVLHGSAGLALAVQAAAATLAVLCMGLVARARPGAGPEAATLVLAALICTPYLLDYDLVCLGVSMAWLAGQGSLTGWRPWEKILLCLGYMLPLEARNLNAQVGVPLMPVLLVCLLAVVVARLRRDRPGAGDAAGDARLLALAHE